MKLTIWNCQGAYRKKASLVPKDSDIIIISECSKADSREAAIWYGDSDKKGIAVYSKCKIELIESPRFKYVLPLRVNNTFTLLAVWTQNMPHHRERYIGQIWGAVNHYECDIIAGDWNSNKIWDYKDRVGNHSDVVKHLADKGIHSAYHAYFQEEHGQETRPTFYLYKNKAKPYHIDYCFVSGKFNVEAVEIVDVECSDHSPVIITLSERVISSC